MSDGHDPSSALGTFKEPAVAPHFDIVILHVGILETENTPPIGHERNDERTRHK